MIHFVTAYDPATHANLSAIRSVLLESDLVGGQATRAGLLRALATRVVELNVDGPRVYAGSYDEYVQAVGREAPGLRTA